jgi:hypothetical protein
MIRTTKTVIGTSYDTEVTHDDDGLILVAQGATALELNGTDEAEDLITALRTIIDEAKAHAAKGEG